MVRLPNWPERLAATVTAARGKTFAYGRHDCVVFTRDCVEAVTGARPGGGARPRYATAASALRAMKRTAGASSVEALATVYLGSPVRAEEAQRGDIVMYPGAPPALGVCLGARAALLAPDAGLAMHPMSVIAMAWRV